ncbi:unnamed protein product, partial [marine sediment metagenome]
ENILIWRNGVGNGRQKIVKYILSTILLSVVAIIWCYIISITLLSSPYRNVFFDFVIVALPFIVIPVIVVNEEKLYDSLKFGAIIGFASGMILSICWATISLISALNPNPNEGICISPDSQVFYMLLVIVFVFLTLFFCGVTIVGSLLSYLIRKLIKKFKRGNI